jgi:hypothetical protein
MTPEGEVKEEIKRNLDKLGVYYFCPVQMGYGKRTVDFLCCVNGKFVGIEAKAIGGKKLTKQQASILNKIMVSGGVGIVATSWKDVYAYLYKVA